jgi:hypothetical protein
LQPRLQDGNSARHAALHEHLVSCVVHTSADPPELPQLKLMLVHAIRAPRKPRVDLQPKLCAVA